MQNGDFKSGNTGERSESAPKIVILKNFGVIFWPAWPIQAKLQPRKKLKNIENILVCVATLILA